jgi:hypothetical protein
VVTTRIKESDDLRRGAMIARGGLHIKVANGKVKCLLLMVCRLGGPTTPQPYISQPVFFMKIYCSVPEDSCFGLELY